MHRKQIGILIDYLIYTAAGGEEEADVINTEANPEAEAEENIVKEYKKLNKKCDKVISKIKTRKNHKQKG